MLVVVRVSVILPTRSCEKSDAKSPLYTTNSKRRNILPCCILPSTDLKYEYVETL